MKNKILISLLFCGAGVAVLSYFTITFKTTGTVIILNGPSAAGKSSLQKEFQKLMMPNLWIKVGIDNLFDQPTPDITAENMHFWQKENTIMWVKKTKDKDDSPIFTLFIGADGDKVAYGMNSAIAGYAQAGNNVIVDYIAYKKEWIDDLQKKLKNINTIWVKITIPLNILEEHEATRKTSPVGHARSHYKYVHWNIQYKLELNSHTYDAATLAKQLKDYCEK